MIHAGGWGRVGGEGKQRLHGNNCAVFLFSVFFPPYDRTVEKCVNNTLQFMERYKKKKKKKKTA